LAPDTTRRAERSSSFLLIAIIGFLVARLPLLPRRAFDPDELEHAHAAWCLFRGMRPYADFFEHHTPWYYDLLRPFFGWFTVDTSFDSAIHFLVVGRVLSFAMTILSLVLVTRLGTRWRDRQTGLLAALLLVAQPVFLQKSLEMRPDMLALPFFLAGLAALLRGLGEGEPAGRRLAWFAVGGLALGGAIMCTQKMLFALPGLMAGLGVWLLRGERRGRLLAVAAIAVFLAGVAVPGLLTWASFAARGAGGAFIANNFLLNASWKHTPTGQLNRVFVGSAPVLALAALGVGLVVRRSIAERRLDPRGLLLACTGLGLFAGVLVIPVAQRQYYLMPVPLACLLAAEGLLAVVTAIVARARGWARAGLLAGAAIGLSIVPLRALRAEYRARGEVQRARLRQVFETTRPTDLVMDGWEGMGVFRPHAFYYYFIHDELLRMLSRPRVDAFLDDLEAGRVRPPRLIALDSHLEALGPRFLAFVNRNYTTRDGFFYYSNN
jgi:hypothetical protein